MTRPGAGELATLILEAQHKGFSVFEDDDGLWYLNVPKAPRYAANVQGSWRTAQGAWRAAAAIAREFPAVS